MITKESLEVRYTQLDTNELLEIISANSGYTQLAISIAVDELKRRNVAIELIKEQQHTYNYQPDPALTENCLIDLNLLQKIVFYIFWIIWVPRFNFFTRSIKFREKGYILKSQQTRYYAVNGFIFSIVALISGHAVGNAAWFVWLVGLIPVYLLDIGYNKQKQINKLQSIMKLNGDFEWD